MAFDVRPEVSEQIESMGAEFVFLDFEEEQTDGAETGGYAAPSSPEFREKQLEKFRELAPDVDIVITTALIPGRDAPKLWLEDMVAAMKPGSVVVDLAAERGGNCDLTVADEKVVSDNGVTVVGYTDTTLVQNRFFVGWAKLACPTYGPLNRYFPATKGNPTRLSGNGLLPGKGCA